VTAQTPSLIMDGRHSTGGGVTHVDRTRHIVITGAAGGLGAATARLFAARGRQVIAADLTPPQPRAGISPVQVDVTDATSVGDLARRVDELAPDGIQAVVNFAGVMSVGVLVGIDEADLRRVLGINVLGTYRVNKALFESVRRGRGRIVNISSETGWQSALMLNGPYAMSKHAIEAYSDALRRELMFLDVPVIKVRPGPFRTDMVNGIPAAFARAEETAGALRWLVRRVGALAANENDHARDPSALAEVIWTAVTTKRPRPAYSIGTDRRRALLHYLPARVADAALRVSLRPGRSS
jgi:NAD(P)-dependent dehydrogenase (short-subunit alcohol dehydrogenase family)